MCVQRHTHHAALHCIAHTQTQEMIAHSLETNFSFEAHISHWHQNHAFYLRVCCGIRNREGHG